MNLKAPDHILSIPAYVPGKPVEEVERERGIQGSIKLASNENPLGEFKNPEQGVVKETER